MCGRRPAAGRSPWPAGVVPDSQGVMDAERRGQPGRRSTTRSVPLVEHRAPARAGQPDGRRELSRHLRAPSTGRCRAGNDGSSWRSDSAAGAVAVAGGRSGPGASRPSPAAEGALTERVDVVEQAPTRHRPRTSNRRPRRRDPRRRRPHRHRHRHPMTGVWFLVSPDPLRPRRRRTSASSRAPSIEPCGAHPSSSKYSASSPSIGPPRKKSSSSATGLPATEPGRWPCA